MVGKERSMSKLRPRNSAKQTQLCSNNQPEENNQPGENTEGVWATAEILKQIREFRMETSVNFETLMKKEKKEPHEEVGELKKEWMQQNQGWLKMKIMK